MRNRLSYVLSSLGKHLLLIVVAAFSVVPFYWMLNTALKSGAEVFRYPPSWLPKTAHYENFATIFKNQLFGVYLRNSIIVSSLEAMLTVISCLLAAYGFYRFRFRWKKLLMLLCIALYFIPFEVIMTFNYRTMIRAGLGDTLTGQILPFLCNFFYVLILYRAFQSIPESIYISACVDGASDLLFLFRIAWPSVRATVLFVFLLSFVSAWNAFLWPSLIINVPAKRTLPFGVYTYMSELDTRYELVMAMSFVTEMPPLLLFILLRKYFLNGFRKVGKA